VTETEACRLGGRTASFSHALWQKQLSLRLAGGGQGFLIYGEAIAEWPMREDMSLLIVEDNAALRDLLASHLSSSYQCAAVASAEEAMQLFTRLSFSLVLTDVLLPGVSGLELCRFIQASYPETVVIAMSGSADLKRETDATRSGAFDYLRKPFGLSRLESALRQAIRHRRLFRELHAAAATSE
jgi:DNA-binding NtrC family response regulator